MERPDTDARLMKTGGMRLVVLGLVVAGCLLAGIRSTFAETPRAQLAENEQEPPQPPSQPPRLRSLQVAGGGSLYPAFHSEIHHYALVCPGPVTLSVAARGNTGTTRLTLLRRDPADNRTAIESLTTELTEVSGDHDIVITVSDTGTNDTSTPQSGTPQSGTPQSSTYVVHCVPPEFPTVTVLSRTEDVTDGLLFLTPYSGIPTTYLAIIDNNGVPRFHRRHASHGYINFRRQPDAASTERYSVNRRITNTDTDTIVELLDEGFQVTESVTVVAPLTNTDLHDFLITADGNRLFTSYHRTTRDFRPYGSYSQTEETDDAVIQEVTPAGAEVFRWSSWDHRDDMVLGTDCRAGDFPKDYAHLNSLQLLDGGDILASFRNCGQVLRIDRSSGTGAVVWKLGGSEPPPDSDAGYLRIVDDPAGEFCGQHQATLTGRGTPGSGTLVLFDNGYPCLGPRKTQPPFTRVVEYRIDVAGATATYVRQYVLPSEQGVSKWEGGVTVLDSGNWLIAWGNKFDVRVSLEDDVSITEVDPRTGAAVLRLHMSNGPTRTRTYRVYREPEADVRIPFNLP